MKLEQLRKRLDKQRPMTTISMRFPVDVLDDLKRVAPLRGFSGYQPLIRAYVGQGLRADLERLEQDPVTALVESLKRHGVSEEVLQEERIRLFDALLLLLLGVGCALMTLVLLTFALVIIFWDHRVLVLILLTLAYALAAGGALWTLWRRLRDWKAFAATLDEFKKDRACLDEQK